MKKIDFYRNINNSEPVKGSGYLLKIDNLYFAVAKTYGKYHDSGKYWNATEITTGFNMLSIPENTKARAIEAMENHPSREKFAQVIQDAHKQDRAGKVNPMYSKIEELAEAAGFSEALKEYRAGNISLEALSEIAATGKHTPKLVIKPNHYAEPKEPEKTENEKQKEYSASAMMIQDEWLKQAAANMAAAAVQGPEKIKPEPEKVQEQKEHDIKVGDIFHASWGYEQTNNDFFQVVKLCGKKSVRVREVNPPYIESYNHGPMSEYRRFKNTKELLPPVSSSVFIKDNINGDLKRIDEQGDIKISSFAWARKCSGEIIDCYESWYY